ncbi:MAG: hypothetical protein V3U54_07680 [Thermodesulfobacteriota bacterium]
MNNFYKLATLVKSKQQKIKPTGYPKIEPLKTFCNTCGSPMLKKTFIRFKGYSTISGKAHYKEVSQDICSLTRVTFFKLPFILADRKVFGYANGHDDYL